MTKFKQKFGKGKAFAQKNQLENIADFEKSSSTLQLKTKAVPTELQIRKVNNRLVRCEVQKLPLWQLQTNDRFFLDEKADDVFSVYFKNDKIHCSVVGLQFLENPHTFEKDVEVFKILNVSGHTSPFKCPKGVSETRQAVMAFTAFEQKFNETIERNRGNHD
ncbi:hypothetical protein BXY85_3743 [Roseivirga pacifica]|uniref:Uncharacterized protein n=1 Tax=Roseivirga pacifica TaxID=1267423 RepID=A0A1I0Q9N3_9BACT|nr:hypothetical protein [Roseivirga pacifica]RKQ43124.1 hypothetical protein BXY85_3743 [Roseivirga pacifica]SEW23592.1 hypothetical protein SAMN05216290_2132 [Roseivirga pacifica]